MNLFKNHYPYPDPFKTPAQKQGLSEYQNSEPLSLVRTQINIPFSFNQHICNKP